MELGKLEQPGKPRSSLETLEAGLKAEELDIQGTGLQYIELICLEI